MAILGISILCFNVLELQTVFNQVAAIMNSRPLTSVLSNAGAPEPLTPGHFLIGRAMNALPIPCSHIEERNLSMRWKRIQAQTLQFWRKWQSEYLQHLRCLAKWTKKQPNLQPGQIVLVGDDNNPVDKWPMGIVVNTQARIRRNCPSGNRQGRIQSLQKKCEIVSPFTHRAVFNRRLLGTLQ